MGFGPMQSGFADRPLCPLGHVGIVVSTSLVCPLLLESVLSMIRTMIPCLFAVSAFGVSACAEDSDVAPNTIVPDTTAATVVIESAESFTNATTTTLAFAPAKETVHVTAEIGPDAVSRVSAVAREAGFGDPFDVDMPASDSDEAKAWLTGEGSAAVGLVTETPQLWVRERPDCEAVVQRLEELGTPQEILNAALTTPDVPTSEVLATLHTSVLVALSICDPAAPASAESAWQWIVAYRRLAEMGVIQ